MNICIRNYAILVLTLSFYLPSLAMQRALTNGAPAAQSVTKTVLATRAQHQLQTKAHVRNFWSWSIFETTEQKYQRRGQDLAQAIKTYDLRKVMEIYAELQKEFPEQLKNMRMTQLYRGHGKYEYKVDEDDCNTTLLLFALGHSKSMGLSKSKDMRSIVNFLIDNGANLEGFVKSGTTIDLFDWMTGPYKYSTTYCPLYSAIWHGWDEVVEKILNRGYDLKKWSSKKNYSSPLHAAIGALQYGGNLSTIDILLKHGSDVHEKDCYEETPLHKAIGNMNPRVVIMLLKHGADRHAKDKYGETCLELAKRLNKNCTGNNTELIYNTLVNWNN